VIGTHGVVEGCSDGEQLPLGTVCACFFWRRFFLAGLPWMRALGRGDGELRRPAAGIKGDAYFFCRPRFCGAPGGCGVGDGCAWPRTASHCDGDDRAHSRCLADALRAMPSCRRRSLLEGEGFGGGTQASECRRLRDALIRDVGADPSLARILWDLVTHAVHVSGVKISNPLVTEGYLNNRQSRATNE